MVTIIAELCYNIKLLHKKEDYEKKNLLEKIYFIPTSVQIA